MATSFSDRIGVTKPKDVLQVETVDADLRNGLWQACIEHHFKKFNRYYANDSSFQSNMTNVYVNFFKKSSDNIPYGHEAGIQKLRDWFFKAEWWSVYNFIEFLMQGRHTPFVDRVSFFLEREKSGYRVIGAKLVPITDPVEIAEVVATASLGETFEGAREHIHTSISLFSQKPNPDYRNAIKEAISAVESAARVITGNPKAALGDALKTINEKMSIHPALREAMNKLYGYSSDEGGIRHAMLEESNIDEAEAKFMIVACSAFVNFCVQRSTV